MKSKVLATALGLCCLAGGVNAAHVEDIVRDTQRMISDKDQVTMVWWIPQQFWVESFRDNQSLPEDVRMNLLTAMNQYTVLALLKADIVDSQLDNVQTREQLILNTRFAFNGSQLKALDREEIHEGVLLLLSLLRPALVQSAGSMGEGMEFVVYPAGVPDAPPIDAGQPGSLDISFYDRKFTWRLPLGSLLPPKMDNETGESFPGNYLYNPYTGRKLDSD